MEGCDAPNNLEWLERFIEHTLVANPDERIRTVALELGLPPIL
jgi:hypothetical protein